MRDTTHLEYTAEDYISYKLQEAGLLVAKPKFDRDGCDLIALLSVKNGSKFGKVQSKGRSLKNSPHTNIKIPCDYVTGPFFLFVYISYKKDEDLYVFFREDIKKWEIVNGNYSLNISKKNIDDGSIRDFLFDVSKTEKIKDIIKRTTSDQEKEMYKLLRLGNDIIKKEKEIRELSLLLNKIKLIDKDKKIAEKELSEAYTNARKFAEEIIESAPIKMIEDINRYKEKGFDEEYAFSETQKDESISLDKQAIWLIILYLYNSIEQKF
jgi:hypothetical protein